MSPPRPFSPREGRQVFDATADAYAAARPEYPERVYRVLRERCGLGAGTRVLEIGAGSGLATVRLLEAGASVVAVEPSPALASRLRGVGPSDRLEVIVGVFEETDLAPSSFDLVAAATAYHWLDVDRSLPILRALLRPGGWLALWWHVFGDPAAPDPFHEATQGLLGDLSPSPSAGVDGIPFGLDAAARTRELSEHGFVDIEHETVARDLVLTAARTRLLYATYSNIARLADVQRTRILEEIERVARDEFDDRVERRMLTPIYTTRTPSR